MGYPKIKCRWVAAGFVGFFVLIATGTAVAEGGFEGTADPSVMVTAGPARFTVLTPTLLRLEFAEDEVFEDRPSLFAVQRRLLPPRFERRDEDGWLVIETEKLRLRYRAGSGKFSAENLSIELIKTDPPVRWQPGQPNNGNLGGTVRTLDQCRGRISVGEGVLSRNGWYVLDDSGTVVFDGTDKPWPTARPEGERLDWYFFGYGFDYPQGLRDLIAVGGPIPLPPRFVFGSWYSRYWPYTADDFLAIADGYKQHGYPLDVMVIDMDWHQDGWTGYTWNRDLIPDPPALLQALHDRHLKVTLNLHPHNGVQPHERAYPAFARAMGVDPASKQGIAFDIADPTYAENYLKLLHHPLESQGVDFWWIDWQQERTTKIPGLDPLIWLNHLHFQDRARQGTGRRGLTFSRWGGWGNHRYPIQFSGDTESTWQVLQFLVPFTSTAGNVGAAYWSHDLGGHFSNSGRVDPELYARWLWFGAFSATMRVHSTRDPDNDRRPWLNGPDFERAAHAAYDLRYQLLPYIYTMARATYDTGLPLNRPMYLQHPTIAQAYLSPGQFYFGDHLIVAPVVQPGQGPRKIAQTRVWLPAGEWYDLLTNVQYTGPAIATVQAPLDRSPVFVRGGKPIPMQPPGRLQAQGPLDELVVRVYPGPGGEFFLYEDDGLTSHYQKPGGFAKTRITQQSDLGGLALDVNVHPPMGGYPELPASRTVVIQACSIPPPAQVLLDGRGLPKLSAGQPGQGWSYDPVTLTATARVPGRPTDQPTPVRFQLTPEGLASLTDLRGALTWRTRLADCAAQAPNDVTLGGLLAQFTEMMTSADQNLRRAARGLSAFISRTEPRLVEQLNESDRPTASVALATLLGAHLQTFAENDGTDRLRVVGQLTLAQPGGNRPVTAKMTLSGILPESELPDSQAVVLGPANPGRAWFELAADGRLLQTRTGRLTAQFD
ncbi:MAG: TIM-barrel domain-containing protein, partial [Phycisphaerae bacterium]